MLSQSVLGRSRQVWREAFARAENRVCAAHAAMMIFGLVSVLGVWRESAQGLRVFCGMCAGLVALLCGGSTSVLLRMLRPGDAAPGVALTTHGHSVRLAHWFCHANRSAGAPPRVDASPDFGPVRGQAALALFLRQFPVGPGAKLNELQEMPRVVPYP